MFIRRQRRMTKRSKAGDKRTETRKTGGKKWRILYRCCISVIFTVLSINIRNIWCSYISCLSTHLARNVLCVANAMQAAQKGRNSIDEEVPKTSSETLHVRVETLLCEGTRFFPLLVDRSPKAFRKCYNRKFWEFSDYTDTGADQRVWWTHLTEIGWLLVCASASSFDTLTTDSRAESER